MKKAVWGAIATIAVLVLSTSAFAQTVAATATVNVSVNVASRAILSLSTNAINFADADPDTVPVLTAPALNIGVRTRVAPGGAVNLTVIATSDLDNGTGGIITIDNLTWTATGTGFAAGTSAITAQPLGNWSGSGNRTGTQTYSLPNSWNYATGNYQTTLTYTLTVP